MEAAIELAKKQNRDNIFIIGGGMVYKYALEKNVVDIIYLTRIHAAIKGDTFFPNIDMKRWEKTSEKLHQKDNKHKFAFTFFIFEKISK